MSKGLAYVPDPGLVEVARRHLIAEFPDALEVDYEKLASEAYVGP